MIIDSIDDIIQLYSADFSWVKPLFAWQYSHSCLSTAAGNCLLEVCEFDNVRKRMSVLLRMPSGEILLYVKGADSSILPHVLEPGAPEIPRNPQKPPETKVHLSWWFPIISHYFTLFLYNSVILIFFCVDLENCYHGNDDTFDSKEIHGNSPVVTVVTSPEAGGQRAVWQSSSHIRSTRRSRHSSPRAFSVRWLRWKHLKTWTYDRMRCK